MLPPPYADFYIANGTVRVALNTLAELFSNRQVIGIYGRDLVLGMTQQQPA